MFEDFSFLTLIPFVGIAAFMTIAILRLRTVVDTNEVHIVQSGGSTKSFGKGQGNGNVYYDWPQWLPVFGCSATILPVSVFSLSLNDYEAYDKGRLPLVTDVVAFFRISDSNTAAQRAASFEELETQLKSIVQGAVRTILAKSDIDEIMSERARFGAAFTEEVTEQLPQWGVETVRAIELMDVRDAKGSHVIHNIMEKRKSFIEMESRKEVASNRQQAEVAEAEASQVVALKQQDVAEQVGLRTANVEREVGIANEKKAQAVLETKKETAAKSAEVIRVQEVQAAEIKRQVEIVKAEQSKTTAVLIADGQLEQKKREAEGVRLQGEAEAAAEKAKQLAPIEAQIQLAEKVGANKDYQGYMLQNEQIKANQAVGVEQAKALSAAEIKVIVTSGTPGGGLDSARSLFSAQGGSQVGAALEAFAQTDTGKAVLDRLGVGKEAQH